LKEWLGMRTNAPKTYSNVNSTFSYEIRLDQLKVSRERNAGEMSRLEADLQLAEKELEEANSVKSGLNSRFIMYQNLRGYVTDLVDCLRCKVHTMTSSVIPTS
jgi:hypothetical protein